ncbi:MAG: VOC family protein [Erysipelotrichia bacterium]|nr:VOC family protein [Erysipelotrichia bacterium]NCC53873.1 VOC family protein [Erysipelotrichia bacterium]
MKLDTTYICVNDMEKSLNFYNLLLQTKPLYCNDDRWATYDCGNQISLYNRKYDEKLLKEESNDIHFNQSYIDDFLKENNSHKNNIVILNFTVEDLKSEYERITLLGIGKVSEIMYVNVHMPYYYFNVIDPDGNVLEITGNYTECTDC